MNLVDNAAKPLKIQASSEILNKLEKNLGITNILIIYFPVTIGPILRFYLRNTNFTEMIFEDPDILGEITIIGKYAKAIKLRNGATIYIKDFKISNTLIMLMAETKGVSEKIEIFLDMLINHITEVRELDPVKLTDILEKLVNNIEFN